MPQRHRSWGLLAQPADQARAIALTRRHEPLPSLEPSNSSLLPYGNGRSYGDVCLNDGGRLLDARGLDRFMAFDATRGRLRCEAGVTLGEILELVMPQGFVLPTTPGTRFVTLGGAIANDVHGKNHHRVGSFGCHVLELELLRSDGTRLRCSPDENPDWFAATIGGLGLTGLITWAEIALTRIANSGLEVDTLPCADISELIECSATACEMYEHTVAWLDCTALGARLGRGFVMGANHVQTAARTRFDATAGGLAIPLTPPVSLVNGLSLKLFNSLYYRFATRSSRRREAVSYGKFCYPLDRIRHWNRMYGRRGFFQYQCVVPREEATPALTEMLEGIAASGNGSFLAVLKVLGSKPSPGLLSFARPGITLALDFPNNGPLTLALLDALDRIVTDANGAVYPAKDARMSAAVFQRYFPRWGELSAFRDPQFSSSFWRRVTGAL